MKRHAVQPSVCCCCCCLPAKGTSPKYSSTLSVDMLLSDSETDDSEPLDASREPPAGNCSSSSSVSVSMSRERLLYTCQPSATTMIPFDSLSIRSNQSFTIERQINNTAQIARMIELQSARSKVLRLSYHHQPTRLETNSRFNVTIRTRQLTTQLTIVHITLWVRALQESTAIGRYTQVQIGILSKMLCWFEKT